MSVYYLLQRVRKLLKEQVGATAVEYAVMLMLIVAACITAISLVGQNSKNLWKNNSDSMNRYIKNAQK